MFTTYNKGNWEWHRVIILWSITYQNIGYVITEHLIHSTYFHHNFSVYVLLLLWLQLYQICQHDILEQKKEETWTWICFRMRIFLPIFPESSVSPRPRRELIWSPCKPFTWPHFTSKHGYRPLNGKDMALLFSCSCPYLSPCGCILKAQNIVFPSFFPLFPCAWWMNDSILAICLPLYSLMWCSLAP